MAVKTSNVSKMKKVDQKYDLFDQLLLVVIATTVITIPFIFDSFTAPKLFVLAIGLAYISIRIFTSTEIVSLVKIPRLLNALICLLMISILISWVVSDVPFTRGFIGQFGRGNGVFYYFFVLSIFILSVKTFRSNSRLKMHELITVLSWFMAIYAGLQRIGIDIAKLDTKGVSPVVLTFGNSNFAGGMLSVLFAYQLTYVVISRTYRLPQIGLLASLLLSSTFAAAVQGYLIILFSAVVAASIVLIRRYPSNWVRRGVLIAWGLGIVTVVMGVFGKFLFAGVFSRPSFQIRIEYWNIALNVMRDFPLFGVGPDKLYDVSSNYMAPGTLNIITTTRLDNAHNWFLNFGVNFGVIALFLLLVIFGWVFLTSIRLLKDLQPSKAIALSSMVAFVAMFIDALVSLEQPGIGVWLYFFAGVTVSASLDSGSRSEINWLDSHKKSPKSLTQKLLPLSLSLALTVSGIILGNRIYFDGLLRSNVQTALLNKGTPETFSTIESASLKLRTEPEYAAQSLRPLAAIGDGMKLDTISRSFHDYYPQSIQATLIRADVLRALNRLSESCPLRTTLIQNTPWDIDLVNKYIDCHMNGYVDPQLIPNLTLAIRYFSELDRETNSLDLKDSAKITKQLIAISTQARALHIIGSDENARSLQSYGNAVISSINTLMQLNPNLITESQVDYFRNLLDFD
jgi:O-antigen ligase